MRSTTSSTTWWGDEVSIPSAAGGGGASGPGTDPADMPDEGGADREGGGVAGPRARAGVGTAALGSVEVRAVREGEVAPTPAGGVSALAETVLGAAYVGTGVLLRDGGRRGREDRAGLRREPAVGLGREGLQGHGTAVALSRL